MYKLSYEQIQTIQENTTRKLIHYINDFIKEDNSLDSIEFYYPDFDDEKTIIAFNVWVSIDYRTDYGKSFIEHMLEEKSQVLSSVEKEILRERNKSFISLFEVLEFKGEFIYVLDILTRRKHKIWEPALSNILKKSDLIFGRIGRIIDYKGFIGNISFLPPSVKDTFVEEIFIDYNRTRLKIPDLTMDKYLKYHSVNVYRIYTECIYNVVEFEEDVGSILYDELDEFENYLSHQLPRIKIKKHINNLINLFEFYLMEEELTLYDLDQFHMEEFLDVMIEDGFVTNQSELNSYICTLKKYLGYLKNKSALYKDNYEDIAEISKNRFLYLNKIQHMESPFEIDKNISYRMSNMLNEQSFDFIMDYEKFLIYLMNEPLELTKKRKYIKRNNLLELNSIMENQENIEKKTPNQPDFQLLHLFYIFSLDNGLIKIEGNYLIPSKKAPQFLRLNDGEKYSLFLQYILSNKFLSYINDSLDEKALESIKGKILDLLSNLEENVNYKYSSLLPGCIDFPEFLLFYYKYLELLGLLKYNYRPSPSISVTSFGKMTFRILTEDEVHTGGKLIDLKEYQSK